MTWGTGVVSGYFIQQVTVDIEVQTDSDHSTRMNQEDGNGKPLIGDEGKTLNKTLTHCRQRTGPEYDIKSVDVRTQEGNYCFLSTNYFIYAMRLVMCRHRPYTLPHFKKGIYYIDDARPL